MASVLAYGNVPHLRYHICSSGTVPLPPSDLPPDDIPVGPASSQARGKWDALIYIINSWSCSRWNERKSTWTLDAHLNFEPFSCLLLSWRGTFPTGLALDRRRSSFSFALERKSRPTRKFEYTVVAPKAPTWNWLFHCEGKQTNYWSIVAHYTQTWLHFKLVTCSGVKTSWLCTFHVLHNYTYCSLGRAACSF